MRTGIKSYLHRILDQLVISFARFQFPPHFSLSEVSIEQLAEEVVHRARHDPASKCHAAFYRLGYHLLAKHFYLPIPDDTDELDNFWVESSALVGVDMNDTAGIEIMEKFAPRYLPEFRTMFPIEGPLKPPGFYLINGGYMAIDAHVYYCLIRHHKPSRIVEIGNGNSTLLAIAASKKNEEETGQRPKLTSIDPYPWSIFRQGYAGLDDLIVKRVQDVPLSLFEQLEAGDILFIDSSHVIRSGNDVHYEYLEILPRLKPGVLVHVHDISLPKPYPKVYYDNHLYWNEQYLLQAFLLFNDRFEVIWPGNYLMLKYPERMLAVFPEFQRMRQDYPMSEPTAFWMRVKLQFAC